MQSRLDGEIKQFQKKPTLKSANIILKKWDALNTKLSTYLKDNPNNGDHPDLEKALGYKTLMEGEFKNEMLDFYHTKRTSKNQYIQDIWQSDPKKALELLSANIELGSLILDVYPDKAGFAEQVDKDKVRKQEIRTYIDDGSFHLWNLSQVVVSAPEARDATIEGKIKSELTALDCEVSTVSIQSKGWEIESNGVGIPLYRYKPAEVGMKQDGKCWWLDGEYRFDYAGGGKYNSTGAFFTERREEMSCDNLK